MLREPLSADQLRLLSMIFGPFDQSGEWPVWQYPDIILDSQYGLDAAELLESLPVAGERGPMSRSYGLTWRDDSHRSPIADSRVALTVAGMRYVPEAVPLLGAFQVTMLHMIEVQRHIVPSPGVVVQATVSSESIAEQLLTASIEGLSAPPVKATLKKLRQMLGHEPYLFGVHQPQPGVEEWTIKVPAILRAYRGVDSIQAYLDRVIELWIPQEQVPAAPPSSGPLDIPYAIGYLDAVWKARTGSQLFVNLDPASVARLTLACTDQEDFNSLMSALADVLAQVTQPGKSGPPQREALERVREWLVPQLDADAADRVTDAFAALIRLRHIRVSSQHADARHKAVGAFREIGLAFPPPSWDQAWTHVVVMARGALDVIREEVHAGLAQQT
jgi:hypothetical protein